MTATVITSENSGEFYAAKMGASAPPPAEAAPEPEVKEQGAEPVGDNSDAPVETDESGQKKVNPKVEKRFSELTKQREDARREAAEHRAGREAAEKRAAELEAKLNPPKSDDPKPEPTQFKDAFEYAEALAEWSADQALKKRDAEVAERERKQAHQKVLDTWQSRQRAFMAEAPDYSEVVQGAGSVSVSDAVRDAILDSDMGPALLYHLAKNPDVVDSLNSKSAVSALRELGRLEAKLTPAEKAEIEGKPVSAPKTTRAPAPITPIRSGKEVEVLMGSNNEFRGTFAQWKAAREAKKIK